ncbi:MAG: XkdF-like putative serine protease domain-containing protein, partial [Lachnospiraceae bacterium]|nr:XkdF-like putative serine protease domain-containing protein [Lachnospiraceae bacterium]
VKKGTWLMTVEITDNDIFDAIEKGDITGFSMGGVGRYSNQDVSLEEVEKTADPKKKKSMLKSIASKLGFDVVEKGFVKDKFVERVTSEDFWQAFYSLQDALFKWNYHDDRMVIENDPELIKEALTDFNEIVTGLLTAQNIEKSVEAVCKAGKKMSSANKETLKQIYENLGEFVSKFNDEEEEIEVTKAEIQEIVKAAVAECFAEKAGETPVEKACATTTDEKKKKKACAKSAEPGDDEAITKADVQEMIDAAIRKATGEEEPEQEKEPSMEEVVAKAVETAMAPFMKQAGLPTNLNNAGVQKADEEQHYMHGYI